jgi:drug/metabolite transporter (DMT)-like permease
VEDAGSGGALGAARGDRHARLGRHYLLIRAYDYASATLLAPYTYSGLIWAMALGFVVFGNFPDGWALTGMGIIVASGLFLVSRQRLTVHRD